MKKVILLNSRNVVTKIKILTKLLLSFFNLFTFTIFSQFKIVDSLSKELEDFPRLSVEILKNEIMFGSYQINHSLSYLADNFKKQNGMNILINDHLIQGMKIITTKIQSRHRAKNEYLVYLNYLSAKEFEINNNDSIRGFLIILFINSF